MTDNAIYGTARATLVLSKTHTKTSLFLYPFTGRKAPTLSYLQFSGPKVFPRAPVSQKQDIKARGLFEQHHAFYRIGYSLVVPCFTHQPH